MKTYTQFTLDSDSELIIAQLYGLDFDSFQELDGKIEAFILDDLVTDELKSQVDDLCKQNGISYEVKALENKNWNEIWESNFEPVNVGTFCRVRADFHLVAEDVTHDIIINPKMAFGTGHHETTYMMIDSMSEIELNGKSVFDFGCGTSVLAILAKKLGSDRTLAIDIEEESASNSAENAEHNGVEGIDIRQAVLADIIEEKFDIILANINRQVLLDTASDLTKYLTEDGILLISGIMHKDEKIVEDRFQEAGFTRHSIKCRGDWHCIRYHLK